MPRAFGVRCSARTSSTSAPRFGIVRIRRSRTRLWYSSRGTLPDATAPVVSAPMLLAPGADSDSSSSSSGGAGSFKSSGRRGRCSCDHRYPQPADTKLRVPIPKRQPTSERSPWCIAVAARSCRPAAAGSEFGTGSAAPQLVFTVIMMMETMKRNPEADDIADKGLMDRKGHWIPWRCCGGLF